MRFTKKLLLAACCCSLLGGFSSVAHAETVNNSTIDAPYVSEISGLDEKNDTTITWYNMAGSLSDATLAYQSEISIADNAAFENAKSYMVKDESYTLNRSEFGTNGKRFYVRVRTVVVKQADASVVSAGEWSEVKEWTVVKINKSNFPGLYTVLKNGGKANTTKGVKKIAYDKDKNGWLDPAEIGDITTLSTMDTRKNKKLVKAPVISSFKGVEYLHKLSMIDIARFSGSKVDLSKNKISVLMIEGISNKNITVKAPDATYVSLQPDEKKKIAKIDISACENAVEALVYGNKGTKTLKLPKNKENLKVLSLSDFNFKGLNLNSYTNLQQVYIYKTKMTSLKVNKCKNLRYVYFYYVDGIKKLDLSSNKKLRGADFYQTPGLTKTTVKKSKSGKYTWNKGKWWYSTKAYKNDMKKIY